MEQMSIRCVRYGVLRRANMKRMPMIQAFVCREDDELTFYININI